MKKSPTLALGLITSVLLAGASGAGYADVAAAPKAVSAKSPATDRIVDHDFGRLSADGVSAFNDIHLARRAIFDGATDEAAKFVADAKASLAKAKTDDAVFLKVESAMRGGAPAGLKTPVGPVTTGAPIAWIPIDTEISFGESFVSTPENAAAVVTARKSLERGENAKSLEAIKLAHIDIDYTVAVAPLDQSIAEIGQADSLIASHDYYGASQALRQAEAGIRYEEFDDVANAKGSTTASTAKAK